jgi:hypothetical protein
MLVERFSFDGFKVQHQNHHLKSIEAIINMDVSKYNELMKYRDSSSSCYHYAAYVAKLMDYYHIPYKCYSGVAVVKGSRSYDINYTEDQLDRLPNTHVWIISNNKYYESFNNSSDVKHLKVDKEFICK